MTISQIRLFCLATVLFGLIPGSRLIFAQESTATDAGQRDLPSEPVILKVGTKQSPPFAIKNPDGSWSGISIELWRHLADELNLEYELEEMTLPEMLSSIKLGELDAGVAAVSVTSKRLEQIEFCHPHFSTGLGIAVRVRDRSSPRRLLCQIVSTRLLKIVAMMTCIVVICGILFWLFERKSNAAMFGGKRRQGIGMGVWWSIVMLLGHKGVMPVSMMGRILATLAMFGSIMLLSILTGVIASVLTVQQLDSGITQVADLHYNQVATVASSTSASYLRMRQIFYRGYDTPRAALDALDRGKADAVVYDRALLRYLASDEFADRIEILPVSFNVQEYAIALPPDSPLRKPLNEQLLRYRESDQWDELIYRYLGE